MEDREDVHPHVEDNGQPEIQQEEKSRMSLFDWLSCVVAALICGVLIFVFVGRTIGVEGRSMQQTLKHNDRVIMSNLLYTPSNGDIIVFKSPHESFEDTPLVKRIIAIEGQTIDIDVDSGYVFVDGNLIEEPYIDNITHRYDFYGPLFIPSGYVFVMGDNRGHSTDSRSGRVGLVDTRYILGKVHFILFPGIDDFGQRNWSRVGFVG